MSARIPRDPVLWMALALVLATGAIALSGALAWRGNAFPGFLVLDNRVVASAGLPDWPDASEVYQHEITMAGGQPIRSAAELRARTAAEPPDTSIAYRFERGGRAIERSFPVRVFGSVDFVLLFGAYLLNGLAMTGAALGIRTLRGSHPLARATFPFLMIAGLWGLSAMDLYGPAHLFRLHALAEALLAPAFITMALGFPQAAPVVRRFPWLVASLWVAGAAWVLAYQLALAMPAAYSSAHLIATSANGVAAALFATSQIYYFVISDSFESRQRIKLLAIGTALAMLPPALISLASAATHGGVPQNLIALTAFLFPVALAHAVLRHDLLGIDDMIRRSTGYAVVSIAVTGAYFGSAAVLQRGFEVELESASWFRAGFPVLVVAVLLPARDAVQRWVDRTFFRTAYDFRQTVESASRTLASVSTMQVVASEVLRVINDSFAPTAAALFARTSASEPLRLIGGEADADLVADAPGRTENASQTPWDLPGGALAVPIGNREELIGVIYLGRRLSGQFYGGEDRRLLAVLASQAAVALANSASVSRIHELNQSLESKVEERTRELAAALEGLRVKNEQLELLSSMDPLSGLYSRRFFFELLERERSTALREGSPLCALMIDIDHFKRVNDAHGHRVGDEVIRRVGLVIAGTTRKSDVCGRIGGEELALLLPRTRWRKALEVAERIRGAIELLSFTGRDGDFGVTVSIGVAVWNGSETDLELLERADSALYRAKSAGRNRVEIA
jgi:diguanylate cyclase (GGDEF)-like protein